MGNVKNNLKRLETEVRADIARYSSGGLSAFDKGDRRAFTAGGVIGAVGALTSTAYASVESELGDAFNKMWDIGLKVSWGLAAVMALIALVWTLIAGSREVSRPLAWLRRILFVVVGINFIATVINWAKGVNSGARQKPKQIMGIS